MPSKREGIPRKILAIAIVIGVIATIIGLISLKILPAPTSITILFFLIEFVFIFFLAVVGGIFIGMYLYHSVYFTEEIEPWEEAIYRIYSRIEEIEKTLEEIKKKLGRE